MASPGETKTNPIDGAELVWIPRGAFRMGSKHGDKDEQPEHRRRVPGFWMYRCQVTNEQYRKFVAATGQREPGYWRQDRFSDPQQPVVGVSWREAQAYCQSAQVRLPTEAEWEYAARAGKQLEYGTATGDLSADLACLGTLGPEPVGSYPPNPFGLHDMCGNVWEWCSTKRGRYPYSDRDGRESPSGDEERVLRGGCWYLSVPEVLRCTNRNWSAPDTCVNVNGFRCAQDG